MSVTLVVPPSIAQRVHETLDESVETGAVLLASAVRTPSGRVRLLATEFWPVPDESYVLRTPDELLVASSGFVPPLGMAEGRGAVPIWMHTHPGEGSSARRSEKDVVVDGQLSELFRLRASSPFYASLIVARDRGRLRFTGLVDDGDGTSPIERLWLVGPELSLISSEDKDVEAALPGAFDRQVRAFGRDVQRVVQDLTIAIVGCGGTGSATAEQLVRLGARHIHLFDPDAVSASNVTRLYGSYASDVGCAKVDVVARHLERIAPDVAVEIHPGAITMEKTARMLVEADIVFGCTDDNAGRLVLSRLSSFYLTPVIDMGVILTSDSSGFLDGIHGRVTVLHPGAACLVCRGRIDMRRASLELMDAAERESLVEEGYAPAMPGVEPAVVSYTTMVASIAVSELLERLVHFGPRPVPTEVLVRAHDREVSTNRAAPTEGHYCCEERGRLGRGDTEPFLEQAWVQ